MQRKTKKESLISRFRRITTGSGTAIFFVARREFQPKFTIKGVSREKSPASALSLGVFD